VSITTFTLGDAVTSMIGAVGTAPADGAAFAFLALVAVLWLAR